MITEIVIDVDNETAVLVGPDYHVQIDSDEVTLNTPTSNYEVALFVPGPQGPPGGDGRPGEGPTWWFGHGPPGVIIGSKPDDRYLDQESGNVYRLGD